MASQLQKVGSAVFYGVSSVAVIYVNKIVLTTFHFPSFLVVGIGQMVASVVLLGLAHVLGVVVLPPFTRDVPRRLFPLPLLYVLNLVFGLGGTQKLSLPMFTVLRRFSILMTMLFEYLLLGINPSLAVRVSVGLMVFGAVVAAANDLAFDLYGYCMILMNDLCTSSQGVVMKKKLDTTKDLGKYGLMFYNSLFMLLPSVVLAQATGDLQKAYEYSQWGDVWFCVLFGLSCVCGFVLNYAILLSTYHNSALTTACIGPIKNLFVTYGGMILMGDYVYSLVNFVGINISAVGSVLYTYVTFRRPPAAATKKQRLSSAPASGAEKQMLMQPKPLPEEHVLR